MWALRQMRRSLKKLQAFRDRRDGVAALEFSLVALPLFFLLFVILETGYFFLLSLLQTIVCDKVFLIGCSDLIFDVHNFTDFDGITGIPALPTTQASATFAPGNPGSTVVVRVIHNWSFITPFIVGVIDVKQMVSTVAFRNEPN